MKCPLSSFLKRHIIKYSRDDVLLRELLEESGLTVDALEKVGNIKFEFVGEPQLLDVHIFRADDYNGKPTESEGMLPRQHTDPSVFLPWCYVNRLIVKQLWDDTATLLLSIYYHLLV